MEAKGYKAVKDELCERGIDASFGPHLFEDDQTRSFHIYTAGEVPVEQVLAAVQMKHPEVKLVDTILSEDGRVTDHSLVDEKVEPEKSPYGESYAFSLDRHESNDYGIPTLFVNVSVPQETIQNSGLRGVLYTLDIYPMEDEERLPEIKRAIYAAYDNIVVTIQGSVRKATRGYEDLYPSLVPNQASAFSFFPQGNNPRPIMADEVPLKIWEELEEIKVAADEVALTELATLNDETISKILNIN